LPLTSEPHLELGRLGWDEGWAAALAALDTAGLTPARIGAQLRGSYTVFTEAGVVPAEIAGRFRHAPSPTAGDIPAVGDWVALDEAADRIVIRAVLPRRTAIARKAAGRETVVQVLAANVDVVLVVSSLDGDPNARRIERYLSAAWESGARPVVALTKADLDPDAEAVAAEIAGSAFVPVHAVSAVTGLGLDAIQAELAGDRTLALVGPSGAGKSTLVNRLLGAERQATHDIRRDGKGRHTTTHRELFLVPGGGVVIDTPGLRELGLWGGGGGGTNETFSDIAELAAACRFTDCAHETEPGCAVRAALDDGRLDAGRLESCRKLERELAWMERRRDGRAVAEERRARRRLERSLRTVSDGPWKS
jgi:ribosome biogenesis GTPase / thiamine phosphate phosphatase